MSLETAAEIQRIRKSVSYKAQKQLDEMLAELQAIKRKHRKK